MSKKNKLFLSCDESQHICDKSQYKEASLWEKIKLNIHLIYCDVCRKYTANNSKLTKLMKNPKVVSINQAEKDEMKERLKQKMAEE